MNDWLIGSWIIPFFFYIIIPFTLSPFSQAKCLDLTREWQFHNCNIKKRRQRRMAYLYVYNLTATLFIQYNIINILYCTCIIAFLRNLCFLDLFIDIYIISDLFFFFSFTVCACLCISASVCVCLVFIFH
jgi:hypothetical protein